MDIVNQIIAFLLGLSPEQAGELAGAELVLRSPLGNWTMIFLSIALFGLAIWSYRHTQRKMSKFRRTVLTLLRIGAIALMLLLIQRPVLQLTVEGTIRRTLLIGIDTSSSSNIADVRIRQEDLVRAAIAKGDLNADRGLNQGVTGNPDKYSAVPRMDVIREVLSNEDIDLIPRLDEKFDLVFFTFNEQVSEISNPLETNEAGANTLSDLVAESPRTQMGSAVREMLDRKRGQPLAGMLLMTDGASNGGMPPMAAAASASQDKAPLYFYGVGITEPLDIVVNNLYVPEVVTVEDEVNATIRFRGQGLAGQRANLALFVNGKIVDGEDVTFTGNEQTTTLNWLPTEVGEYTLEARIDPRSDETSQENNSRKQRVRVIDSKINVLLAENMPRWEFRYLEAALGRDRRIDLDIFLNGASPAMAQGEGSHYITEFPTDREKLFEYDIIILGDLPPAVMGDSAMQSMQDWVSQFGGGLILLAGRENNPWNYLGTPLSDLVPIEFQSGANLQSVGSYFDQPINLELTAAGSRNPMLQFLPMPDENAEYWQQLPPIYWVSPVTQAKPTTEVLAVDPSLLRATRFGKMPVIALQGFGLGSCLYLGTDNFWRWRALRGGNPYWGFWSQVVQRMAMSRLLTSSSLSQLNMERNDYVAGDRVKVFGRLFKPGYRPYNDAQVSATLRYQASPDSADAGMPTTSQIFLQPAGEQAGFYEASFLAARPGTYTLSLDHDETAKVEALVSDAQFELGETAMNAPLMERMAEASGGRFFREEDLAELPDILDSESETVKSLIDVDVWSSPLFFMLLIGMMGTEWLIRKLTGLK
ncbi:CARDB domain-containing protein [Cerasicoccus fimbriatus]|uniref:CARDB domain-containing protein n=1 Tax=Cerasicoccus fimbriatus TaxID=3014554 RepID=UPI0022B5918A|nr:CARDB domain-containing protein [Cerasicoccus sp. TK19100]